MTDKTAVSRRPGVGVITAIVGGRNAETHHPLLFKITVSVPAIAAETVDQIRVPAVARFRIVLIRRAFSWKFCLTNPSRLLFML